MIRVRTMALMAARRRRDFLTRLLEPVAHEGDLVLLGGEDAIGDLDDRFVVGARGDQFGHLHRLLVVGDRSEEHTSELQSLMRISYAVFCLKKTKTQEAINTQVY